MNFYENLTAELIRDAGLWKDMQYMGGNKFVARFADMTLTIDQNTRSIAIKFEDADTRLELRKMLPRDWKAFAENAHLDEVQ